MASCQMKFSHLVKVIAETTPTTWQAPHSLRAQRRPMLLDHPGLVIVVLLPPLLHLQEAKIYSPSESTVHINLHCHNPYNVPDHSADVAAA